MCDSPYFVDNPKYPHISNERQIPVPCGRCPVCEKNRISQWSFRLREEAKRHEKALFITLTYDSDHLPRSPKNMPTLVKKDVQNYMKRLRKLHPKGTKIKYYFVGEYGSINRRPHYHAIIFGADDAHIEKAWMLNGVLLGLVDIGTVTGASIAYCCKYINKAKRVPQWNGDDRLPEFSLKSLGLGSNYLDDKENIKYHKANLDKLYIVIEDGIKIPMPRYYRDKIFTEKEKEYQQIVVQKAAELKETELVIKLTDQKTGLVGDDIKYKFNAKLARLSKREKAERDRKL